MSRPRKPTKLLELSGAFKQNPQRRREAEPMPTGEIGPAPDHLNDQQKAAWAEIVQACCPGVLTSADRLHVEITACLVAQYRETQDHKLVKNLISYLGRLGLNPSDRSRVAVIPQENKSNKWANVSRGF